MTECTLISSAAETAEREVRAHRRKHNGSEYGDVRPVVRTHDGRVTECPGVTITESRMMEACRALPEVSRQTRSERTAARRAAGARANARHSGK